MLTDLVLIQVQVTPKEAALLKILRENPYGKFVITTHENQPLRVIIESSKILKDEDGYLFQSKEGKRTYTLPTDPAKII